MAPLVGSCRGRSCLTCFSTGILRRFVPNGGREGGRGGEGRGGEGRGGEGRGGEGRGGEGRGGEGRGGEGGREGGRGGGGEERRGEEHFSSVSVLATIFTGWLLSVY